MEVKEESGEMKTKAKLKFPSFKKGDVVQFQGEEDKITVVTIVEGPYTWKSNPTAEVGPSYSIRYEETGSIKIIGAEYLLKLLPQHTHDFAKFIRPAELTAWARQAKLHVCDMAGINYNVLTKVYKLSDDVSVNYLMHLTP